MDVQFRDNRTRNFTSSSRYALGRLKKLLARLLPELYSTQSNYHYISVDFNSEVIDNALSLNEGVSAELQITVGHRTVSD